MKKLLIMSMVSLMSAAILAGCGGAAGSSATTGGTGDKEEVVVWGNETENKAEGKTGTQLANPWRECDKDEIGEVLDAYFIIPEEATDVRYSLMEEDKLAQADFTLDGLNYTARMKRADEFSDISGCNYEWDVEDEGDFLGSPSVSKRYNGEKESVDLLLWMDESEGLMFSLSTSDEDLDGFDIEAVAQQMYQPSYGEFIPGDFMQERTGKNEFASYDEVISSLEKGEGYAYVTLKGYDGEVLLITDYVYDNLDGNMATIEANVYADYDGVVSNIGNIFSQGTAYPIACEDGILYVGGNHSYESDWISGENQAIMVKDYIYEDFDSEGNSSYGGFLRKTPDYDHDEEVTDENGKELLDKYTEEYFEKQVVNFTVVE
ncbi:MAG: hypothetical protein K6E98_05750 [Lachnospiraceae bacterium]|nr:hypothetical protein [Lachnospiraceae bacterium]